MTIQLPNRLPGTRWITALWGVYLVGWSLFEGELWTTVLAGVMTGLVLLVQLLNRPLAGRAFSRRAWLVLSAALGACTGFASGFLTLIFMAIKTGLHAHGPEYSAMEVAWVLQQIPLWSLAGLIGGLGVGFVLMSGVLRSD